MPSGGRFQHALCKLPLETGYTHHEKFIEVIGKDCKELHPFQNRVGFIPCLVKDMVVEPYPAQFTVDVERRIVNRLVWCIHGQFPVKVQDVRTIA